MNQAQQTATAGFTLFQTAIGACGIAWRGTRVTAAALPSTDPERTRARLGRLVSGVEAEPPPEIASICRRIAALLAGEASDLGDVELDMDGIAEFDRRVYATAREIAPGQTLTYGEVARRLGDPALAREVGASLGRNRFPPIVPCHRVVAADGRLGGFSAPGGRQTKQRLLELERVHADPAGTLFTI